MAIGYYICLDKSKADIMKNGITAIHPSGIYLYIKNDEGLHRIIADTAAIVARLHECDRDEMCRRLIVFETEYDEADIIVTNGNHIVINTKNIPADKIKFIGKYEDLNTENT